MADSAIRPRFLPGGRMGEREREREKEEDVQKSIGETNTDRQHACMLDARLRPALRALQEWIVILHHTLE